LIKRIYRSAKDSFFPDETVYLGRDFGFCNTNDWGGTCKYAKYEDVAGVFVCGLGESGECSNRIIASDELVAKIKSESVN
jgi:hypothetical protein